MIRIDLLLQFAGRAECSFLSLSAKINFLLIFCDKFCSFIGEYYGFNPRQSSLFQCFLLRSRINQQFFNPIFSYPFG